MIIKKFNLEIEWEGWVILQYRSFIGFCSSEQWSDAKWMAWIGPVLIRRYRTLKDLDKSYWAEK